MVDRMLSDNRSMCLGLNTLLLVIIFIMCIYYVYEKKLIKALEETCYLITLSQISIIIFVVIFRIRLLIEELYFINSDYKGNFGSLLAATMNFNIASWAVIAVTSISFLMLIVNTNFNILQIIQFHPLTFILGSAFSLLLLYIVNITECKVTKVASVFSSGGLDPGTAMACSYFYGYLKIILPASGGNERLGILKALETYEDQHNIKVPVKKLFILIPSSSYIPPDLREVSDMWLKHAGSLETIAIDRAGVKNRTYHNTIYKIYNKEQSHNHQVTWLATEGATPLKTFLEVQDQSHRYAALYREYNGEIIKNFYKTLKNLLEDNPDCRDYCELVYYEDFVDGKRVNPAKILLDRIAQYNQSVNHL